MEIQIKTKYTVIFSSKRIEVCSKLTAWCKLKDNTKMSLLFYIIFINTVFSEHLGPMNKCLKTLKNTVPFELKNL